MIMIKKFSLLSVFCAVAFGVYTTDANAQTIVGVAQSEPAFSSLVTAVVAADLAETLSSEGPFTVFAPTNDAFATLPGYIGSVLASKPELLSDILLYHVVAGELKSSDVVKMSNIDMVSKESVMVTAKDGSYFINNSKITSLDVMADNGVIHVIDQVLIPRSVYQAVLDDLKMQLQEIEMMIKVFKRN
jgi:uncharacterized surface protein with fasciclin (FAS1) repeats